MRVLYTGGDYMHKGGSCMAGKKDSQPLQSFNILQLDTHGQRDISKGGDYTWGLWHGVERGGGEF